MKKAGPRRGPVLFCPSHWAGEFSRDGGLPQCAPIFFLKHQKENGRTRSKEKMFRRVGPHTCGPPAAGGGWLAVQCGSQGRKRPALGESFGPGRARIPPASTLAAATLAVAGAWGPTGARDASLPGYRPPDSLRSQTASPQSAPPQTPVRDQRFTSGLSVRPKR